MEYNEILKMADEMNDYLIDIRRTLHRHPETSGEEQWTSTFLQNEIKKIGLPIEMVSKTGFIATLDTHRPGPHIVLRADIDALPVLESEENLKGKRICISEIPGCSHVCGHDAHMAMLLASMKLLVEDKENQSGVIYFCFEEGEEIACGLKGMLDALEKRRVDTCWGIHVYAGLESNKICLEAGPRMAGAAETDFEVVGKGGHGSRPDMAINPVFCAAAILTNLGVCWPNQITAGETVTLGITTIQGGEARNIIPDTAEIKGTLRYFSAEEGDKALELVKTVAEHTAAMHQCTVKFGSHFRTVVPPVVNDEKYAELAKEAVGKVIPKENLVKCEPWYASDDFGKYLQKYPGIYAHLGLANEEYGSGALHHNSQFDLDESILTTGVKATLAYVKAVQEDFLR